MDWNANQVMAVLAPYLEIYGKAKKSEILKIVGTHITDKQLRNFLTQLKDVGLIKTEGVKGNMLYMLGDNYIRQNNIIAKAIGIGLQTLKDNGEK